eukprot:m.309192 g.309192  ORF g.309192 m.309192 type:complete len:549 (+) comp55341_c0_seq2:700-2346(+)
MASPLFRFAVPASLPCLLEEPSIQLLNSLLGVLEAFLPASPRDLRTLSRVSHPDSKYWRLFANRPAREGESCCSGRWITANSITSREMFRLQELVESKREAGASFKDTGLFRDFHPLANWPARTVSLALRHEELLRLRYFVGNSSIWRTLDAHKNQSGIERERLQIEKTRGSRRALVVFLGNSTVFRDQLNWLMASWRFIGADRAGPGATDFVIVHSPPAEHLVPDECASYLNRRLQNRTRAHWAAEPGLCVFIKEYGIVYRRREFMSYKYLNSIGALTGRAKGFLLTYGAIMHLDLDTFLTPRFQEWWPVDRLFVGQGGYGHVPLAMQKLEFLSEEMGLRRLATGGHNLGSSWYGPSEHIVAVAELTIEITRYLIEVEFAHQPCWKFHNVDEADMLDDCLTSSEYGWGTGFYPGVAGMYASEIAINHLWATLQGQRAIKHFGEVELSSTFNGTLATWMWTPPAMDLDAEYNISVCATAHIHTFHGERLFSKFAYANGHYDAYNVSTLNVSRVPEYALYLALRANNKTPLKLLPPRCQPNELGVSGLS